MNGIAPQNGFTLLEIVIALAIVALSLTVVYAALAPALTRHPQSSQARLQLLTAQSLLEEAELQNQASSGSLLLGPGIATWQVSISALEIEHSKTNSFKPMIVTVNISSNGASVSLNRITLASPP